MEKFNFRSMATYALQAMAAVAAPLQFHSGSTAKKIRYGGATRKYAAQRTHKAAVGRKANVRRMQRERGVKLKGQKGV